MEARRVPDPVSDSVVGPDITPVPPLNVGFVPPGTVPTAFPPEFPTFLPPGFPVPPTVIVPPPFVPPGNPTGPDDPEEIGRAHV